jgi:hypothetical protein
VPAAATLSGYDVRVDGVAVHAVGVSWGELADRLDVALNESSVCGISFDAQRDEARLLLEVLTLPEMGPMELDPRRALVMSAVSSVEIILREDLIHGLGPVLPLRSLEEVESLFARLRWAHSMYGWAFVDVTDVSDMWQAAPSLVVRGQHRQAGHTLRWFTECGAGTGEQAMSYFLQGTVGFGDLRVERADGTPVPVEEFAVAGVRWWEAFNRGDRRVSAPAQRKAEEAALRWSPQQTIDSAIIPAGPQDHGKAEA